MSNQMWIGDPPPPSQLSPYTYTTWPSAAVDYDRIERIVQRAILRNTTEELGLKFILCRLGPAKALEYCEGFGTDGNFLSVQTTPDRNWAIVFNADDPKDCQMAMGIILREQMVPVLLLSS